MAQTISSGAASYASGSDLTARYDVRDLAQWVSDTGTPVTTASVPTNVNVLAALQDASGMVESACLVSQRYSQTDLQNLANGTTNAGMMLRRIVCDLAVGFILERRPFLRREVPKQYERALEWLDKLRAGQRIFGFLESATAGNPLQAFQTANDIETLNLATTQAFRFFGIRTQWNVPGPNTIFIAEEPEF